MDRLIVVARPVGNHVITYNDGDVVPAHQTLLYFGDKINYTPDEIMELSYLVRDLAAATNPINSMVIGKGSLGKDDDKVLILESAEMNAVCEKLKLWSDGLVEDMLTRTPQHPNWIQHITGFQNLRYGDYLTFDRLAVWNGDEHQDFSFQYQTVFTDAALKMTALDD